MNRDEPRLVCAADVTPVSVRWLWPGWLPVGKFVLIDGNPGVGKSMITCALAAGLTRGRLLSKDEGQQPVGVMLLNSEDGPADTTRPRLDRAGADIGRVHLWDWDSAPPLLPARVEWLEKKITEHAAALVVIDPLTGFLDARIDSHRDQDVRHALMPLVRLAERTGVTVLGVRHLNKSDHRQAMQRGMGSIAFAAAARMVWLAAKHPDDENQMVLSQVKNNLSKHPRSLLYRIEDRDGVPVIDWQGECDLVADDLVAETGQRSGAVDDAAEWLEQLLADGPVPASEVKEAGATAGHADKTLGRAKKTLGVVSRRDGKTWVWALPDDGQGGQDA